MHPKPKYKKLPAPVPFTPMALKSIHQQSMMIMIYIDLAEKEFAETLHLCKVFGQDKGQYGKWLYAIKKNLNFFHKNIQQQFGHIPVQLEQFGEMSDDREKHVKMLMYDKLKKDLKL